jgi:integrase
MHPRGSLVGGPVKANEKNILALVPEPGKKIQRFPIDGCPCLYIQVTGRPEAPIRSWLFKYRDSTGKPQCYTIGRYPNVNSIAAKNEVESLRRRLSDGEVLVAPRRARQAEKLIKEAEKLVKHPAPPEEPKQPLFKTVAEEFYTKYCLMKNKPSTQGNNRWMLDRHVLPALGTVKVVELDSYKVIAFLDTLADRPVLMNRAKALLSKMFNWAGLRFPDITANHTKGFERHTEKARERRMTEEEIRKLGKCYRGTREPLQTAAIFLLLTGAREGVVLHMTKDHQFPEEGLLRFPPGMSGLKGCRRIYLSRTAKSLLETIPQLVLKRSLWRSWVKLREKSEIGRSNPDGAVSLHDLRRTFGSIGVDLGHDEAVVDALLGHSRGKIKDTYLRRSDPVLAQVAEEIGEHIAGLLGIEFPNPRC